MSCPLTDCQNADVKPRNPADGADRYDFDCPRCGRFSISKTFFASDQDLFREWPKLMEGLRRYITSENERGIPPELNETWRQHADKHKPSVWDSDEWKSR